MPSSRRAPAQVAAKHTLMGKKKPPAGPKTTPGAYQQLSMGVGQDGAAPPATRMSFSFFLARQRVLAGADLVQLGE